MDVHRIEDRILVHEVGQPPSASFLMNLQTCRLPFFRHQTFVHVSKAVNLLCRQDTFKGNVTVILQVTLLSDDNVLSVTPSVLNASLSSVIRDVSVIDSTPTSLVIKLKFIRKIRSTEPLFTTKG
jgi:hypothetical protein